MRPRQPFPQAAAFTEALPGAELDRLFDVEGPPSEDTRQAPDTPLSVRTEGGGLASRTKCRGRGGGAGGALTLEGHLRWREPAGRGFAHGLALGGFTAEVEGQIREMLGN